MAMDALVLVPYVAVSCRSEYSDSTCGIATSNVS